MGYPAKKGMYKVRSADGGYLYRFQEPGTARGLPAKRWFHVEVVRKVHDSKGEVVKRNKQTTAIYGSEDTMVGLAMRRCPDPWPGTSEEVRTRIYYRPLAGDESL